MTEEKETALTRDITEYIKLIKNSRGYTWEIKVNSLAIDKIREINNKLLAEYPDGDK